MSLHRDHFIMDPVTEVLLLPVHGKCYPGHPLIHILCTQNEEYYVVVREICSYGSPLYRLATDIFERADGQSRHNQIELMAYIVELLMREKVDVYVEGPGTATTNLLTKYPCRISPNKDNYLISVAQWAAFVKTIDECQYCDIRNAALANGATLEPAIPKLDRKRRRSSITTIASNNDTTSDGDDDWSSKYSRCDSDSDEWSTTAESCSTTSTEQFLQICNQVDSIDIAALYPNDSLATESSDYDADISNHSSGSDSDSERDEWYLNLTCGNPSDMSWVSNVFA